MLSRPITFLSLFLLAVILWSATPVSAQNPAPKSKQLRWGYHHYGGGGMYYNETRSSNLRKWAAARFNFSIGYSQAGGPQMADSMHALNTQFKILDYMIYGRYGVTYPPVAGVVEETTKVMSWAISKGYQTAADFANHRDSIFIRAGANGAIIRTAPSKDQGKIAADTMQPYAIMLHPNYQWFQARFMINPKNKLYGYYMWDTEKQVLASRHLDGVMFDENGTFSHTGVWRNANDPYRGGGDTMVYPMLVPEFPLTNGGAAPNDSLMWVKGWGQVMSGGQLLFPTLTKQGQLRDTAAKLHENWHFLFADSLVSHRNQVNSDRMMMWPNPSASSGSEGGFNSQWDWEYRHAMVRYHGSMLGEQCYFGAGIPGGGYTANREIMREAYQLRDSAVDFCIAWVRVGQYDEDQGKSFDRSKMNALGLHLECLFPSASNPPTQYYMSLCQQSGQTSFMAYSWGDPILNRDSAAFWSDAMGKYFGVPVVTRDTSQTGVDPVGQPYKVDKLFLYRPDNPSVPLTYICGRLGFGADRWASSANFDSTGTRINTTLPSGTWYELKSTNSLASWSTPFSGGSSITLCNAQFRIFSSDTTLANTGLTGDTTPPSPVNDLQGQ
jgi:hypothetical protein